MKWLACILFALCLQSIYLHSLPKSVSPEDNSIYFKKGVYKAFFNNQLDRLHEVQLEYPGIVFELTLYQLESESRDLSAKRYKTLIKSFQQARLDMNRIVFDSKTVYVKSFKGEGTHYPEESVLDSVGAILQGKVLSLD